MKRLVLVICLIHNVVFADTISGIVRDEDGNTLPGVAVRYEKLFVGCYTDSQGYYELPLFVDPEELVFSCVGFESYRINISSEGRSRKLDVRLQNKAIKLKSVVVAGKCDNQVRREAPNSLTLIEAKEISGRTSSLTDIIGKSCGVKVAACGGEGNPDRIFIQGLDGKRIKVYINGLPTASSDKFSLAAIPLDLIQRIEIYKGIIPSNLAGDGLGGAVNIITNKNQKQRFQLSTEMASYGTYKLNAIAFRKFDKQGIQLNLGYFSTFAKNNYSFDSPFNEGLRIKRDNDAFRSQNAHLGLSFSKTWFDQLSLSASYANSYKELQGGLMHVQGNIKHAHTVIDDWQIQNVLKKNFFDKKLKLELYSRMQFSVHQHIDTSHLRYNFDGTSYPSSSIQGEAGFLPNMSSDRHTQITEQLNVFLYVNKYQSFAWNTLLSHISKDPEDELADSYAQFVSSGFPSQLSSVISGLVWEAKNRKQTITNNLGAKFFYMNSAIFPSQQRAVIQKPEITENSQFNMGFYNSLAWKPIEDNLTIKLGVQQALRIPDAEELFGDGIMILAAPDLLPERSLNVNIGANYLLNCGSYPNARVDFNAYYMYVWDMIKLMSGIMSFAYANIEEVEIKGADLDIHGRLSAHCDLLCNVSYIDARNKLEFCPGTQVPNPKRDLRVPNTPWLFANARFVLKDRDLIRKDSREQFFIESHFTEEYYYNWKMNDDPEHRIPRTLCFNAGLQISLQNNRWTTAFEVHNLTDQERWGQYKYPLPGRTYHVKLKLAI
jgi:outer membrane cobalamin receptor